jgi:flagellar hook-associated protein 2
MATVGISFGSATSGAGFDVSTTVTSILALESAVETPWKSQLSSLQAQDSVLTSLGTGLSTLSTAVSALTDFDGVTASKEGSSSDTSVLTLTAASSSAVAGSHTIVVNALASTGSEYSDSVATASDTLSGSVSIQVGSGSAQTLTLDSTDNTLATLATAINSGSYGVTASIVSDTNGSRLSLVSKISGAGGSLTIGGNLSDSTASSNIGFTTGQKGADAQLTVDGLPTTSASNTVTGAIPGVTFQLLEASTSPIQVQITNDNSSIETAFQSLVTAYNSVVSAANAQEGNDASGNAEPLFGSPTLALLQSQLAGALLGGGSSGSIKSATQLGLSLNADGSLSLDTSALDSVLNSSFGDVQGFLQNSGSFGQNFASTLNGLSSSQAQKGTLYLALQENASEESDLNSSISDEDTRVAAQKTTLTAELNEANQILQSIPQQLNEVNEIYSAITGYGTGNG